MSHRERAFWLGLEVFVGGIGYFVGGPKGAIAAILVGLALMAWSWFSSEKEETDWREMERRFGLIDDELAALWECYDTRLVRWTVWFPQRKGKPQHSERSVERFLIEAATAGGMLKQQQIVMPGFPSASEVSDVDFWLSSLVDLPRESDFSQNGIDDIGQSHSGDIENLVHASKLRCAQLARLF